MPGIVAVERPTFSTVSIMPGMELRAPERQETSSGFSGLPYFLPMIVSVLRSAARTWSVSSAGSLQPLA